MSLPLGRWRLTFETHFVRLKAPVQDKKSPFLFVGRGNTAPMAEWFECVKTLKIRIQQYVIGRDLASLDIEQLKALWDAVQEALQKAVDAFSETVERLPSDPLLERFQEETGYLQP